MTDDFLKKHNLRLILPTETNMLMVDWKTKTAHEMQTAFRAQDVEISRTFPAWPTVSAHHHRLQGRHGRLLRRPQQGCVGLKTVSEPWS